MPPFDSYKLPHQSKFQKAKTQHEHEGEPHGRDHHFLPAGQLDPTHYPTSSLKEIALKEIVETRERDSLMMMMSTMPERERERERERLSDDDDVYNANSRSQMIQQITAMQVAICPALLILFSCHLPVKLTTTNNSEKNSHMFSLYLVSMLCEL